MHANKLRVVYTTFRDNRNPFSAPFPVVNITKSGVRYIIAGHEPFSINNVLNQDAFQVTNDFNLYKKNHSFTSVLPLNHSSLATHLILPAMALHFSEMRIFKHSRIVFL